MIALAERAALKATALRLNLEDLRVCRAEDRGATFQPFGPRVDAALKTVDKAHTRYV